MISVLEAMRLVREHVPARRVETVPLLSSLGHVLAEDVESDLDMPPFRRAQMDGFAVRSEDLASAPVELRVAGEVFAGVTGEHRLEARTAVKIMTGAPVPDGADAVVQVEHTEAAGPGLVRIVRAAKAGANVVPRGQEMRSGQTVLSRGALLRAAELGVLACVGRERLKVWRRPTVAVLTTGDELVDVRARPTGAQIRDSNGYSVAAQVAAAGLPFAYLGIARDTREELRSKIRLGLSADCLVLTGGVSVGEKDLVSDVLKAEGVGLLFHQVAIRPGKPVCFGRKGNTLVFGLPGNPVSTFVCFELFVRLALGLWMGNPALERRTVRARMSAAFAKSVPDRQLYHPAFLTPSSPGGQLPAVAPVPWKGSADLLGLAGANAFLIQPPGAAPLAAGDEVDVLLME
ncbi:MAG: molybdopterin molybdotransferase MoeA [Planctomycetes bacterium]|nr:molybdopterin molybdotransferase MoeA [Planctomycetota bacterium]